MDWPSVAGLLAERSEQPIVMLDRRTRVQFFSRGLQTALGWRPDQIEGRPWAEALSPPDQRAATRTWLRRALRGALAWQECEVLGRDGRRFVLAFDVALVGRERARGVLFIVRSIAPARKDVTPGPGADMAYEIETDARMFGTVRRISWLGAVREPVGSEKRCFELFHRRSSPCPDCPVLRDASGEWPRLVARARRSDGPFEIVTAEHVAADTVRVTSRSIGNTALEAIHQAKLDALAARAKLSEREREVFLRLVTGTPLEAIAESLGIRVRTVKFHQTNALAKLGADSRIDLARLFV